MIPYARAHRRAQEEEMTKTIPTLPNYPKPFSFKELEAGGFGKNWEGWEGWSKKAVRADRAARLGS